MLQRLLFALALVIVIEGILPFICPECWRKAMKKMMHADNRTLRTIGLSSMLVGVIMLYVLHHLIY